jgi:hypothetical protein
MIVIGTDVVEGYFADHAGHKGIKAARSPYEAWFDIVTRADWRNPEDVKASYPKASATRPVALRRGLSVRGVVLRASRQSTVPVEACARRGHLLHAPVASTPALRRQSYPAVVAER